MSDEPRSDPTPKTPTPNPNTTANPFAGLETKPGQAKAAANEPAEGAPETARAAEETPSGSKTADGKPGDISAADDDTSDDGKPGDVSPADGKAAEEKVTDGPAAGTKATGAKTGATKTGEGKSREEKERERRRSLVTTLLSVFVVLVVLTAFGYFGGLGPLGRLSQRRALNPPDLLGGLARITDQETRSRLELDQAAQALSQNNKGETSVEAYGDVASDTGLFVVIALRGKIDVNRTVADSGATADQVQKVGKDTCTTQTDDTVTCYRTSNILTVMVRNSTGKVGVDRVAPMTDEAFNAYN